MSLIKIRIKKIIFLLINPKYFLIYLKYKSVPSIEHIKVTKKLKNINLLIDVGANIGQFSLFAKKYLNCKKIILFEPLKDEYNKLCKLFIDKDIIIHNLALGSKKSNSTINITNQRDSSSILDINSKIDESFKHIKIIKKQIINLERLDNILKNSDLENVNLLKIDVQGFELQVLKGASKILRNIKYIYIECSEIQFYKDQSLYSDIHKYLLKNNFIKDGEFNIQKNMNNQVIQLDILYKNKL